MQTKRLGRCELALGLMRASCEGEHRLPEQLQRELAFTAGAAGYAERVAVGLEVGADPDDVIAVAVGFDVPAK